LKKIFVLAAMILLVVISSVEARDNYTLGFLGNSTNAASVSMFDAVKLAVDEFNLTNTSYSVNAVFFDDTITASDAIKNQGNLLGVVGSFDSSDRAILENIGDVPALSVSDEFPGLNAGGKNNVFRMCASDIQEASDTCRFLIKVLSVDKLGIVYSGENSEYEDMAQAFKATADRNRVWAQYYKAVDPDRKDFTSVLQRLRDLKVHNIYFAGPASQAAQLARQSSELNVGAEFSSTYRIGASSFIKSAKAGSRGAVYASIAPSSIYGFKKFRDVFERYSKLYKGDDMHLPYSYDAAQLLLSALAMGKTGHADVAAFLHSAEYSGATGEVSFKQSGDRQGPPVYFYIIIGKSPLQRNMTESEEGEFLSAK
jgi:branched-chain amino acid transport system substrate-binding protein